MVGKAAFSLDSAVPEDKAGTSTVGQRERGGQKPEAREVATVNTFLVSMRSWAPARHSGTHLKFQQRGRSRQI